MVFVQRLLSISVTFRKNKAKEIHIYQYSEYLCLQIHDPALRLKYRESSRFEKLGYEEEFLNKIRRLDDEVRRKIEKNERRLAMTQPVIKGLLSSKFAVQKFTI